MDAKDIELDLLALQRLYGLLNGDGQSTATNDKLDEHARLLLKNLLDTEAQRVFKAHSEIIAGQLRVIDMNRERNGSVCASGSDYRKKRCRVCQGSTLKQLKPIEDTKFYDDETQNPKEVVNFQNQQKNQFNHFLWDKEQRMGSMVQYKVDESLNSENERKIETYDSKLNGVESTAFSSNRVIIGADEICNFTTEISKEPFEIDYLSKEASEAIKQIELRISALQLGAELSQKKDYVQETKSPGPVLQTTNGVVPLIELSRDRESLVAGNDIQYKLTSQRLEDPFESPFYQVPIRTTNQLKEMKLPNLMSSHPSNMVQRPDSMLGQSTSSVIRSRGPTMGHDTLEKFGKSTEELESFTNWPAYFSSQTKRESPYQNQMSMKERISKHETFQPYMPFTSATDFGKNYRNIQSVVSAQKVTQRFPHKIMGSNSMDKPAKLLLPSSFHEYQSDQHHDGVSTKTKYKSPLRNIASRHQELEGTPSSSYSSNWISRQASSLGSESEERSISAPNRRIRYMSSGSTSDSTDYFPSHDTESHYTSYTSNSEDEVYSSDSSAGADQVTSSSGHNSVGNSLYDQPIRHHTGPSYLSMKSITRRSGPTKIRKSAHRISQEEQSGKWKRFKDRLAIIFHHHHHHHHYDEGSDDQKKMSHSKPLQKNTGKNFRSRREAEAYEEQAVEKLGKSLIRDRPGKNQRKHFHGLMGGLLRHVKHSKRSKPATDSIPQLGKGQHGAKKPLKKSNWWQLLQHHRGSKFPNKPPHVKLGLKKKKAHLRVPKIK
ncbi:uncharacterized protein LOC111397046 isoform X2 [Olea europaea var. sylvestris]|uniref:uncharacterized protein LOC111397046 isoform X2 n=1 Tax=Olea europaea var. sylvestris TaxID=158386 RepID=UPI000C1D83B3|nr:uncharacterized protein LOC111397046 isoform X2 [Olea europaea var. sylvestris]